MEKDKCVEVKIQSVFRNDHGCLGAQSGIWLTYRPEERRCRSFCSPRFTATFVLPASATLTLVHKVSIGCQQEPILEMNYNEYVLFWKYYIDCSAAFSMQGFWLVYNWKHCQRHKGPKELSTLTLKSTHLGLSRSFNKRWTLGQTSAWFCLVKGEKYMEQLRHVTN